MNTNPLEVAARALRQMQEAWNEADGTGFGAPFADDADFVDIRGDHHAGRQVIAAGHQVILDTIYRGSRHEYEAVSARQLTDGVIYALGRSTLNAPEGPLAGESQARFSMVLMQEDDGWKIAAFHNTMVAPVEVQRPV
jgi:uncharacterized protein (TIGR02246 family)